MSQALSSTPVPNPDINQKSIFFASFMTLIAAGIGFAVRGGILKDWGVQFGFTQSELGELFGAGLAGFGITIIVFSFLSDQFGYKNLLLLAFILLLGSAVVTLCAGPVFKAKGKEATYWTLYVGTFLFSLAQGLCEAAINPLTATLFPKQKTHYLNILHAGWPGGLVLGSLIAYLFAGKGAALSHVSWEILSVLYLAPTFYFGFAVLKNKFPDSETKAAGISLGQMLGAILAPMLIFLFLIHAMVGYVELGTDGWIQNIMNNTIGNKASLLLAYTSILMFVLRFYAGPIIHKINPLGLLCIAATCGAVGLYLLGTVTAGVMIAIAATIFALGKTFYWPTMLGVIGERFPRGGALAMGISGGIGMLSAGFLGGPGIGYTQDHFAKTKLEQTAPAAYASVKADKPNSFLLFPAIQGLNGSKVEVVGDDADGIYADMRNLLKTDEPIIKVDAAIKGAVADKTLDDKKRDEAVEKIATDNKVDPNGAKLLAWYDKVATEPVKPDPEKDKGKARPAAIPEMAMPGHKEVVEAKIHGGAKALQVTALLPVTMAICYLLLVFYFISRGGYKAIHLDSSGREFEVAHTAEEEAAIEAMGTKEA